MLTTLQLENYRGFGKYRLTGLDRVNLLVGKNNCGKTSLLEAAHFIVSGGDLRVLTATAWQRGEVDFTLRSRERHPQEAYPVLCHFFYGHEFHPGAYFIVRTGDGLGQITVRVADVADAPGFEQQRFLFEEAPESFFEEFGLGTDLAVLIERGRDPDARSLAFPVTAEGVVFPEVVRRSSGIRRPVREDKALVQFVTPDSLEPRSMSDMWDRVIAEGREAEVIHALRILAPDLRNIFFLSGQRTYRFGGRGGVLAAFEGTQRRDPLGSYGEGMRRLLALSLSLIRSEGGILLVDEIDTGLHYSIMGDMWRLVTEAARRSNVQVFATTHSSDCVRGLAWLCENHPELAKDVSVQKIDCELEEAVALHGEEITLAVNQGMEVR